MNLDWIRTQMPVQITFVVSGDDAPIRGLIRGEPCRVPFTTQRVIVQGSTEANRVYAAMARLKHARGLPFGGAVSHRYTEGQQS